MSNYWGKREAKQEEILYDKTIAQYNAQMAKAYRETLNDIQSRMISLYELIKDKDSNVAINELYKFNRYYDLMAVINKKLTALGEKEQKITNSKLIEMYQETGKLLHLSDDISFAIGDDFAAKAAVKAVWCADGKHWSSRIWTNKQALQARLEKGLIDCVSRGAPKDELVKALKADFDIGFNQADRIARTELTYVQNQAAKDKYKEAGVKRYKILSAHDSRTCDICKKMDGKIFNLDEAQPGVNFPPFHPNDRCAILAVLEGK